MKLAIDATYSLGSDLSGVGVYSRELMKALAELHPEQDFSWCYRPHRFLRSWGESVPSNVSRCLLMEQLGSRGGTFHGLNQRVPERRFARQIVTFHDLFVMTAKYSTPEFRKRFTEQARRAASEADAIIAVSQFTADQVKALLGVEAGRIHVVHHGIRPLPLVLRTPEKIVLHVGAIQERKNIGRLVRAFSGMPDDWKLVLAGSAGYGAAGILRAIDASPRCRDIVVTGYLSETELAGWYARASIFAFPSLDEGFGMPVLEAMRAGVAVLASNRSAVQEVAGEAAFLIDPLDEQGIGEALIHLAKEESGRTTLEQKGRVRATNFTWKKAAEETWALY